MSENKNQKSCQYCHDPFLDLSGKANYEIDEDEAYCGIYDKGILGFGISSDFGFVSTDKEVNINYCPMCGRKLSEADK